MQFLHFIHSTVAFSARTILEKVGCRSSWLVQFPPWLDHLMHVRQTRQAGWRQGCTKVLPDLDLLRVGNFFKWVVYSLSELKRWRNAIDAIAFHTCIDVKKMCTSADTYCRVKWPRWEIGIDSISFFCSNIETSLISPSMSFRGFPSEQQTLKPPTCGAMAVSMVLSKTPPCHIFSFIQGHLGTINIWWLRLPLADGSVNDRSRLTYLPADSCRVL